MARLTPEQVIDRDNRRRRDERKALRERIYTDISRYLELASDDDKFSPSEFGVGVCGHRWTIDINVLPND